MCAMNNCPDYGFFFFFFFPLAVFFMFALNQQHVQDVFGVFCQTFGVERRHLNEKRQNTGEVYRKLNSLRCVVGPQVGLKSRAGGARTQPTPPAELQRQSSQRLF